MPVEILILSGSRQGESLLLDGREFRVGAEPGCEVLFDAAPIMRSRAARRCCAIRETGGICVAPAAKCGSIRQPRQRQYAYSLRTGGSHVGIRPRFFVSHRCRRKGNARDDARDAVRR